MSSRYTIQEAVAAYILINDQMAMADEDTETDTFEKVISERDKLPLARATQVIDTITKKVTISALKGSKNSDFVVKMAQILSNSDAFIEDPRVHGILKYVCSVYGTAMIDNELLELSTMSDWVGEVKGTITESLRILKCVFIRTEPKQIGYRTFSTGFYNAVAVNTDGNLFEFIPKEAIDPTTDFSYKIKAKVKAHVINKFIYNGKTTKIFYIKELN